MLAGSAGSGHQAAAASGSANLQLAKTVADGTLRPSLNLDLGVDRKTAIPGDTLTYQATLTNTGGTLTLAGRLSARNTQSSAATVASYWDNIDTSSNPGQGCSTNHGHDTSQWPAFVGAAAAQSGYSPVVAPPTANGMGIKLTPVPSSGVTYPEGGDRALGTTLGRGATATWNYVATIPLSLDQERFLLDAKRVAKLRNTLHLEVTPRGANAAQPAYVDTCFKPSLFGSNSPGTARNAKIEITAPTGDAVAFSAPSTPGLASLAPGNSVKVTTQYKVPAVRAKGANESNSDYLARLRALDNSTLTAKAIARATGSDGSALKASAAKADTTENLPILDLTKTGPASGDPGSTFTYDLALRNTGGAAASSLAASDKASDGADGTVSGLPGSLGPGAAGAAKATVALPASEPPGDLTDTASVRWRDANGNDYGPISSAFTTTINAPPRNAQVSTTALHGNFYPADSSAQTFTAKPGDTPAFGQDFSTINFNPPEGAIAHSLQGLPAVDPTTRPFTDVTTDEVGNGNGTIVAEGNGKQAGIGPLRSFDAALTGKFVVDKAGDATFNVVADDGFLLGVGGGVTRVSGDNVNPPASGRTPFDDHPILGAFNQTVGGAPATHPITIHFPHAGSYPYELDYFENAAGAQLSLTMTLATPGAAPPACSATGHSLWIGNDQSGDTFQTDLSGHVLTDLQGLGTTGSAYAGNSLYLGDRSGAVQQRTPDGSQVIRTFSLPGDMPSEDMTWDCKRNLIWRIGHNNMLRSFDPNTGIQHDAFALPTADPTGELTPLGGLGVAYDNSRDVLYVSFCKSGCARQDAGLVEIVDPSTGTVKGTLFRSETFATGGLAYESDDDTLWVGGTDTVRHMTRTGEVLSSFPRPQPGGFVDGLEFSPAVSSAVGGVRGGVFVTGHDPDFHAVAGPNRTAAQHIIQEAVAAVTGATPSPKILLVTDARSPGGARVDPRLGLQAAGFTSFDVADYGSGAPGVLDLHTVNFANYDAVVIASDDGGWLRQDELDILDARASDLATYVNGGGGLVALAESGVPGDGAPATTTHGQFGFLPCLTAQVPSGSGSETGIALTSVGQALGLTTGDVTTNAYHNIFPSSCGYDVVDQDSSGRIVSLFQFAKQPPPRSWQSMVYDADSHGIDMFGGIRPDQTGSPVQADSWAFDGSAWTEQHPAATPSPRYNAASAFDAATHTTVLFSGSGAPCLPSGCPLRDLNDTWTFDGTTWTQQHPTHSPSLSGGTPVATYDAARREVVLVTSQNLGPGSSQCCFDTWTWDGSDWTEHNVTPSPPGLYGSEIAYDAQLQKVILFGGAETHPDVWHNETWAWDGSTWTQLHPSTSPPGRANFGMDYDSVHHQIVLFGGFGDSGHLSDTWTFDGTTWTHQTPTLSPPARRIPALTFDPAIGKAVLFGGFNGNTSETTGTTLGDTWLWDGTNWSLFGTSGASGPPPSPPSPLPPATTLTLSAAAIPKGATTGQPETFAVAATDGSGKPAGGVPVTLGISGTNQQAHVTCVPVDCKTGSDGTVTFTYIGTNAGRDSLTATATIDGLATVSNTAALEWSTPATGPAPAISQQSPNDGGVVTKPVAITATIEPPSGQTIDTWKVTSQGHSPGSPLVTLNSGTGRPPAPPDKLATFDPTLLPNDTYDITVSAKASGGGTQSATSTVAVEGNLKLGRYTTTYQDLDVSVNGFQMQVRRVYDSIDKRVGDFGVGWHVELANFGVSENRELGAGGWSQYGTTCFGALCLYAFKTSVPHYVTVTFPDGHQEVFDFDPKGGSTLFNTVDPAFKARPGTGTTSTLEALNGGGGLGLTAAGDLVDANGDPYNPTRFKLTTHDGTVFILDTTTGLVSEADRNGNSVTVDSGGIHASNGESISFDRDSQGRIIGITGPSGQHLTYGYSPAGDLASSTDANGNVTTYSYDASHDLLKTTGPGGKALQTLTYDANGRLATITDADGNTTKVDTDVAGRQQTVTDPNGKLTTIYTYDDRGDVVQRKEIFGSNTLTTNYTYDAVGRPTGRTDPLGHTWAATYNGEGDLTHFTLPSGHAVDLTYDAFGNPVTETDPLGKTTRYDYDGNGNLSSVTDPLGDAETFAYDGAGRVTAQTDRAGNTSTYTYDSAGNLETQTDPLGHATHYTHDASGNLASVTDPLGHTNGYAYDGNGNLNSETDPLGHQTTYTYDALNRALSRTDPLGRITRWGYTGAGDLASTTDPVGGTTTYTYDADHNLLTAKDPRGGTTSFGYDGAGRLTGQTDPLGRATSFAYDDAGNQIATTDPAGHATHLAYDAEGRLTGNTDPLGKSTTYSYDAAGNLTGTTNPLGNQTTYSYDAAGRRVSGADPAGNTTDYTYDPTGRLTRLTDGLGGTVKFSYDAAGNRTALTDPNDHTTSYTYDPAGQLTRQTDPLGRSTTHTYDAAGQPATTTDGRGITTTYGYDADGELTSVAAPGQSVSYSYDGLGRRTSMTDGTGGGTTYSYDPASDLTSVAAPAGTVSYTYDAAGQRQTMTLGGSRQVSYGYDQASNLTSIKDWLGKTLTYGYDADGQQTSITRPNGVNSSLAYDAAGQVISVKHDRGASPIAHYDYSYDANGNRTSVTTAGGTENYSFDELDRLTRASYSNGDIARYTYDAAGNRTSSTLNGATTNATFDAANQLTSNGPTPYTYDGAGNLLTRGSSSFSWDSLGRLSKATVGGQTTTYAYDGDGLRTSATSGVTTTPYLWDRQGGLPQLVDDGTNGYVQAGGIQEQIKRSTNAASFPLADALGSVQAFTDSAGTVTGTTSYDAFGNVRSQSGATSTFGFTGEQTDPTGLLYLRARYVDPSVGRFLSPDTIQPSAAGTTGYNLYAYAGDNPPTVTDPSGNGIVDYAITTARSAASSTAGRAVGFCVQGAFIGLGQDFLVQGLFTRQYQFGSSTLEAAVLGCAVRTFAARKALRPSKAPTGAPLTEYQIGRTVEDILETGVPGKVSRSFQYLKPGGIRQAQADFDRLAEGAAVANQGGGISTATLSNGTKITVRPSSSGGLATLDIRTPGNPVIKIRYSP